MKADYMFTLFHSSSVAHMFHVVIEYMVCMVWLIEQVSLLFAHSVSFWPFFSSCTDKWDSAAWTSGTKAEEKKGKKNHKLIENIFVFVEVADRQSLGACWVSSQAQNFFRRSKNWKKVSMRMSFPLGRSTLFSRLIVSPFGSHLAERDETRQKRCACHCALSTFEEKSMHAISHACRWPRWLNDPSFHQPHDWLNDVQENTYYRFIPLNVVRAAARRCTHANRVRTTSTTSIPQL